tara:strand:+ start:289 stop:477 length:189 start_codon:yes stop_codon:yes gene_type:complete
MSFKSFAGIILVGLIGLAAVTSNTQKEELAVKSSPELPVEFYNFEDPLYITPAGGSDASLDH